MRADALCDFVNRAKPGPCANFSLVRDFLAQMSFSCRMFGQHGTVQETCLYFGMSDYRVTINCSADTCRRTYVAHVGFQSIVSICAIGTGYGRPIPDLHW